MQYWIFTVLLLSAFDFLLCYTGGNREMPISVSFRKCLDKAKLFTKDAAESWNLAGQFLEQEFTEVLLNERAKAALAEERAKAALAEERAKAALTEERAKVALAEERARAALAEQRGDAAQQLLQTKEDFFNKIEEQLNITFKSLNMDRLRARGLLSSRGLFEWYLKLVFEEHRVKPKDKFFATTVCKGLGALTSGLSFYFL
jgi:hypothetical protein